MPTTSRPKTEDKFSRARAAKNSPERQEAAKKRGPVRMKKAAPVERHDKESMTTPEHKKDIPSFKEHLEQRRMRDEERVSELVLAILSAWQADVGHAENTAASAGIIKVSRRQIEGALRGLKNTRFTKIPTLINNVLVYNEIVNVFGQWVYVEHDSPDWIFVRLPENSTPVLRATISFDRQSDRAAAVATSSESLLDDSYLEDETAEYDTWTLPELQGFAQRNDFLQPDEEGFHDRASLIHAIMRGETH